jgi:hypothetical protein
MQRGKTVSYSPLDGEAVRSDAGVVANFCERHFAVNPGVVIDQFVAHDQRPIEHVEVVKPIAPGLFADDV